MSNQTDIDLAITVHKKLLEYFGYPEWRNPLPALDELVSTILSQNTNDRNRDIAFNNLRERFPEWEMVRDADPNEVVDAIRTAGLANQKGPRIQNMLKQITEEHGSLDLSFLYNFSKDEIKEWLLKFKGVGLKTASIVMQFSLNIPAFPVDTHIHRVTGRIGLRPEKMNAENAHSHLAAIFPEDTYKAAHLNIIRLGREICHPRNPQCVICPLSQICLYANKDR